MIKNIHLFQSFFILVLFFNAFSAQAQDPNVYVDEQGVMHWENNDKEVHGFGVNYSVPFAHAYRAAERLGVDHKQAIDNDIYHFSRLGFDLYRIHVWDTQISDTLGNLIENEHLELFDYLLKQLSDKGINYVITPIAFWGSGWPEPDPEEPGFSHHYGKGACLTDPACIAAQQEYLYQFMNHENKYTGVAYKDDPHLIAVEISNEPHHREEPEVVTNFVKKMVKAIERSGTEKPIFYNASHAVHLNDAYFKAGIDGGTFQWYPTGLGYQREILGNLLPNVDDYNIPFENIIDKYNGAKLVYEFDAADVGRSYIYPAMARSFREAGIQLATYFSYDPTYMANVNTEYNTHYMNLAYTPQKALGLMIASEVFHHIPMEKDFGTYPENTTFGDFMVSYKKDLATYNTDDKFIFTNHTDLEPKNIKKLKEIAGFGNCPLVRYDGSGVYFLNKIDKGVWRLEVMPDAVWVDNPFGRNSPDKIVGVVKWEERDMSISLPDLEDKFNVLAINEGNDYTPQVSNNSFSIRPGTYIISKKGTRKKWSPEDTFGVNQLKDFYAPESTVDQVWLKHEAPIEASANQPVDIKAQIIAPEKPENVQLVGYSDRGRITEEMMNIGGYIYSATIPADELTEGYIKYNIIVKTGEDEFITYPAGKEGRLWEWDFYDRTPYQVRVVSSENPIYLFDAKTETDLLVRQWRQSNKLVPTDNLHEAEYQIQLDKIFRPDNENLHAEPIYDYSIKHYVLDNISGRKNDLEKMEQLVIKGQALKGEPQKVQIALVMEDGTAFGKIIEMEDEVKEYTIDLDELEPVKTVTLPRPYPTFLPYYLEHINSDFDIEKIESLQLSIGPGIPEEKLDSEQGLGIRRIWLE